MPSTSTWPGSTRAVWNGSTRRSARELAHVLPSLADDAAGAAPALHERYRTHRAMRELLEQLAATKPLVLVLDDVHWADPASIDLLVALVHRPPAAGVVLTIAARPRQLPPRLATALDRAHRAGALARLELEPLTREQARELVGGDATRSTRSPAATRSTSSSSRARPRPRARRRLRRDWQASTSRRWSPRRWREELALLSDPARRVLDAAAVAGDPFEVDLAAAAAGVGEEPRCSRRSTS